MTSRSPSTADRSARPLLITRDDDVLEFVLGIAEGAGHDLEVAPDLVAAGYAWSSAPLVLMDARAASGRVPHRRPGVVLLGHRSATGEVWRDAVRVGAEDVIDVVTDAALVRDRLSEIGAVLAPVCAITGASGGLGASTLAAVTARSATEAGCRVLLVDLDPAAGGLDLVLGAERVQGARWEDLDPAEGVIDPAALLNALPDVDGLSLLSAGRDGAMPAEGAVDAVLHAARRAADLVIVDVARGSWPLLGRIRGPGVLAALMIGADLRGAAGGRRAAVALEPWVGDRRVIARTGRGRGAPADQLAAAVGLPLLGCLPDDPKAAAALERGELPKASGRSGWRAPVDQVADVVGVVGWDRS